MTAEDWLWLIVFLIVTPAVFYAIGVTFIQLTEWIPFLRDED